MKTAVILAAGLGSRLKEKTALKPKGFLEIEEISLIQRSVDNLIACGIEKIYIGTGYLSEAYDEFAKVYPQIQTIKSDKYKSTSSMYTLYNMKDTLNDGFLLLESDLLYEKDALKTLIEEKKDDVILASGKTNSNDEVYIQADKSFNLLAMSKNKDDLSDIYAELTGICKVSLNRYKMMCEAFEDQDNAKIDYEYIMVQTAKKTPFYVKKVENLIWCEIDDASHLHRALTKILPKIKAKAMKIKRNVLLNPGPATTSDSVKLAQVVPDICPREKEFGDLMEYVSNELTTIVANTNEYTTVLFGGSGTSVVEAILTSVVPHDKTVLIVNNGAYGKRMCQIASRYKMNFIEFKSSSIEPINLEKLEDEIKENKNISHLSVIHNETTTGLLNNLDDLGALAKKYNLELIVDAMSSYAAVPIDMKKQNIHYLAASSNKNIQGMAGVGFVIANKSSVQKLKDIEPRSFYLSLYEQYENFIKSHQMRFTPPVQTLYALKQAIIEAKEEGVENRYARYSASWEVLINTLKEMDLKYLVDDKYHSKIITSIFIPNGIDFNAMHNFFFEKGFTIYPGKVEEFNTFRIANIGEINSDDMEKFLVLLKNYFNRK
ncbi:2-aminoethylphosphonate aminotransferase [Pasteurella atlantica]|uniref:2-aminoethylphosphonate aminotransferase n=1 Tax=Pasteurellaceae TaxID=712 RepID=UPI002769026F|nr:2-aminoethylphosphonate--pyruvate transaminase [Pasteurella atlantica]MDP8098752.1 2-aminoethylphosphonate--pyruvate transaminase [Pasteurella atlantica]MDP8106864.1 2-aminoethylphosphonate--pyruvate transaminase [Pasteurella atlantica]MDP8116554.1 2-aminoethylphosphonate--pyruvate transaminase [Pasteurella atlantica]